MAGENSDDIIEGEDKQLILCNPHISKMPKDVLYHLSLNSGSQNFEEMFGDVKFVCVGGSPSRMQQFAYFVQEQLNIKLPTGTTLYDISQKAHRYSMYKIGPVLSISHGIGIPSMSIMLHEIIKLMYYARCKNVIFIRLGTCGGIGLPGGCLVITKVAVDGLLRPFLKLNVLGKIVQHPTTLDGHLAEELEEIARKEMPEFRTVLGNTMCTCDFYEGQGRLDGAFCDYTEDEKIDYLKKIHNQGVINIEMESLSFADMCNRAGIKGAIICVTLLDRLQEDQVLASKTTLAEWQRGPQELAVRFIKKRLKKI